MRERLKVAVYWVGMADLSKLNNSPCTQTSDFAGKGQKNTKEELENKYLKTVHVVCTNSDVRVAKAYHILAKNLTKNVVNN